MRTQIESIARRAAKDITKGYDIKVRIEMAIEQALAQEQEPVALQYPQKDIDWQREQQIKAQASTPPQRTWVGIEGEEIRNLWEEATKPDRSTMTMVTSFAKSIEAKLKQKNGYAEENT